MNQDITNFEQVGGGLFKEVLPLELSHEVQILVTLMHRD